MKRFVFSTALFALALGALACGGTEADAEVSEPVLPFGGPRLKLEPICVTATVITRFISCDAEMTESGDLMPQVRECTQQCTTCGSNTSCGAETCETECHPI